MKKKPNGVVLPATPPPFPMPRDGEDGTGAAYLARVGEWFENYFLRVFRTFTRADVGKHMHPADFVMDLCISLLTAGVVDVPQHERARFFLPLKTVLREIAGTWTDAAAPALDAMAHVERLKRTFNVDCNAPRTENEAEKFREAVETEKSELEKDLRRLSETLLEGTAEQSREILAAVRDVGRKVDAVGADARAGRVAAESADSKIRAPRADKGTGHRKQPHISGAWKTAADVAEDFDRAAFQPELGAHMMGTCDERKVNRWDSENPDAEHANKWGYHARLRIDPDLKAEYLTVLAAWGEHWKTYKEQFRAWRKGHRLSPRGDFRFAPPKRTDVDPARMGKSADGGLVVEPRPDPRRT